MARDSVYGEYLKRPCDLLGAALVGVATAPLHLACAAAVLVSSGRPIYFHQQRAGKDGAVFPLHKFRTMVVGTEAVSNNYPTPDMVTTVGRVLRRLSLDELPQLLNILRGEMSFVGPRPALPSQVERYTNHQRRRLSVRPGLTGLAQIRYRNLAPWSVRIECDIDYVDRQSPWLDLKILLLTIPSAVAGVGQVVGQQATEVDDLGPGPRGLEDTVG